MGIWTFLVCCFGKFDQEVNIASTENETGTEDRMKQEIKKVQETQQTMNRFMVLVLEQPTILSALIVLPTVSEGLNVLQQTEAVFERDCRY